VLLLLSADGAPSWEERKSLSTLADSRPTRRGSSWERLLSACCAANRTTEEDDCRMGGVTGSASVKRTTDGKRRTPSPELAAFPGGLLIAGKGAPDDVAPVIGKK
jgi:hypothetical protein